MENSLDLVNSSLVYVTHEINCINSTLLYLKFNATSFVYHLTALASSNSKGSKLHPCFNR